MAQDRPFRFGVQVSSAGSGKEWVELARRVEDLGFSSLMMPDHFVNSEFAPLPAITAAAAATERLRVGVLVHGVDYKHPAVLAKESATIDLLSDGRLEFGLGAGWQRTDYDALGLPYDPPGVRVDRLAEALQVVKGLWGAGPLDFEGEHYQVSGLDGFPKPVQQPGPPIIVGGGGKRVLSLAAREADIISINANMRAGELGIDAAQNSTGEATAEKVAWVREAAGERFDDLELNVLAFFVMVTDDREAMAEQLAPAFGLTGPEALEVPNVLLGTEDQIAETLIERRERYGISYITMFGDAVDAMTPVVSRLTGT